MAGKRFEKGSEEWIMFMDFWNLCQKNWIAEKADAYWDQLREDCIGFVEKHDTEFSKRITAAFIETKDLELNSIT